ncbi:hypothetical protein GCM10009795_005210 [Nocardioides hankookensis]
MACQQVADATPLLDSPCWSIDSGNAGSGLLTRAAVTQAADHRSTGALGGAAAQFVGRRERMLKRA